MDSKFAEIFGLEKKPLTENLIEIYKKTELLKNYKFSNVYVTELAKLGKYDNLIAYKFTEQVNKELLNNPLSVEIVLYFSYISTILAFRKQYNYYKDNPIGDYCEPKLDVFEYYCKGLKELHNLLNG